MTVPTISNLPTVPATSDPNFETEAPALFNHIKNTFVSEMNSAISFINSSTFDATVEFKNASFTAAKNFLYMIDTTGGAVTVTLPASPATGDQLLLMDQKRYFATNNLTIGRNGKNINGAASNVVSKSTGALIRCVYNSTYGWTVDLYEGQWESGTSAGDLVYTGGNVGIGTSEPSRKLTVQVDGGTTYSETAPYTNGILIKNYEDSSNNNNFATLGFTTTSTEGTKLGVAAINAVQILSSSHATDLTFQLRKSTSDYFEPMRITSTGRVGIGTSSPAGKLDVNTGVMSGNVKIGNFDNVNNGTSSNTHLTQGTKLEFIADTNPRYSNHNTNTVAFVKAEYDGSDSTADVRTGNTALTFATHSGFADTGTLSEKMRISSFGNVGIGTSGPGAKLDISETSSPGGVLRLSNTDTTITSLETAGRIEFYNSDGSLGPGVHAKIESVAVNAGQDYRMDFYTGDITPNHVLTLGHTGNVEVKTGNLVIGTAGKGIDFGVASGSVTSQLLDDYEEGSFTPVFIDTNGDASFTHDIQKGKYTKVGDCVYFSLTIGTDSVTAGTGDLKISGLPFTAQNSEPQIKPSGAVGVNYSWSTSPISWLIEANSNAIILYKTVNPLTASKSTDCGTTADDNRLYINGSYFV